MTYTGCNIESDYAFHEPQHPLERIQRRKAASNNTNNESAFNNVFETHPQSSDNYIRRRQTSLGIDNNNDHPLGQAIDTITENSDFDDAKNHIHKHLRRKYIIHAKIESWRPEDSTEIVKDTFNEQNMVD
jgi:hypothetical protein